MNRKRTKQSWQRESILTAACLIGCQKPNFPTLWGDLHVADFKWPGGNAVMQTYNTMTPSITNAWW